MRTKEQEEHQLMIDQLMAIGLEFRDDHHSNSKITANQMHSALALVDTFLAKYPSNKQVIDLKSWLLAASVLKTNQNLTSIGFFRCSVYFLISYVLFVIALINFPTLQHLAMYLNFVNFPFNVDWSSGGERFGFRAGSLKSVYINTPDDIVLGAWHLYPRSYISVNLSHKDNVTHYQSLKYAERVYLYFHGNAGNRATGHRTAFYKVYLCRSKIQILTDLPRSHVLAIDYRGFGDSSWTIPTQKGLQIDAISSYNWLVNNGAQPSKIVITGHSLGSGVAADLAKYLEESKKDYAALLLLSAYASIGDAAIGYGTLPILKPFHGWEYLEDVIKAKMVDEWISYKNIKRVRKPILIIHGLRDLDISPWQSQILFLEAVEARSNRLGKNKTAVTIKDKHPEVYWKLRQQLYSHNENNEKIKIVKNSEGEIWRHVDDHDNTDGSGGSCKANFTIELVMVEHAGHNSLSNFLLVEDSIREFNKRLCPYFSQIS